MGEFRMPSLGSDMEKGTLVEWLKKPGDTVRPGDVVAVIETEKGAIEIEAFEAGTFERSLVDIGQTVPVGTPIFGLPYEPEMLIVAVRSMPSLYRMLSVVPCTRSIVGLNFTSKLIGAP